MHPGKLSISDFTYTLPEDRIAWHPIKDRSSCKLLTYDQQTIEDHHFLNLPALLDPTTTIIFNQTRVVPARLIFHKRTGARIEVFCLEPAIKELPELAMQQRKSTVWKCMVGGAAKWKDDMVLELPITDHDLLKAQIRNRNGNIFEIGFEWSGSHSFLEVLEFCGKMPLPPYIKRQADKEDEQDYQTVFAKTEGSVAAPTAGLHFTEKLISDLKGKGISTGYLTLHVGAGTFQPVSTATMQGHEMHAEWMEVSQDLLQMIINKKGPLLCVGTTAMRSIESLYWLGVRTIKGEDWLSEQVGLPQWYPYEHDTDIPAEHALKALAELLREKQMKQFCTKTSIIIAPGYKTRLTNQLITNFHQPGSTLLLLVAAFCGPEWKNIYQHALEHDYKFLSYGDACLLSEKT